MSQECLRTGDKALIRFRFIKYPEYIVPGQRMVFREGRTKAVGNITKIFPNISNVQVGTKSKYNVQQQRYKPNNKRDHGNAVQNKNVNQSEQVRTW